MGKKILIVEDEALIREMLREIFESVFEHVYTADNGIHGIDQFKKESPDLIITDIKMRKMDGLTMIDRIQSEKMDQSFIIITAYSDEEHLKKAADLGIKHLLIKPIDCRQLIKLSRELLNNA